MNLAFSNLRSHLRGLNWKVNRRDKLEANYETNILYDTEHVRSSDEQRSSNINFGVESKKNVGALKKRVNLKKRVKDACARNTKESSTDFADQEICKKPFKKEPLHQSEDIIPDLINIDGQIGNHSKKRLRSLESSAFRSIGGLRRKTGPQSKTEYDHLANEEIEIQHALAFDNLGLECQTAADSDTQSLSEDTCAHELSDQSSAVR